MKKIHWFAIIVLVLPLTLLFAKNFFLNIVLTIDNSPIAYPNLDCRLTNWLTNQPDINQEVLTFTVGENRLTKVMTGRNEIWTPIQSFVIKRGEELIVIDPGPDRARVDNDITYNGFINWLVNPIKLEHGQDLPSQMKAKNLDLLKVTKVIITHAHADHTGNLDAFANATVYINQSEYQEVAIWKARGGFKPEEIAKAKALSLVNFTDQLPFGTFDYSFDLFGDQSVILVTTPGHTIGQISVIVRNNKTTLIPGDALARWRDLDEHYAMPGQHDRVQFLDSLARIECLANQIEDLTILPAHDLSRS